MFLKRIFKNEDDENDEINTKFASIKLKLKIDVLKFPFKYEEDRNYLDAIIRNMGMRSQEECEAILQIIRSAISETDNNNELSIFKEFEFHCFTIYKCLYRNCNDFNREYLRKHFAENEKRTYFLPFI